MFPQVYSPTSHYVSTGETELISYPGRTRLVFMCVLERYYVASTVFNQYPTLSEGADSVDGQLRGDKEYPFSGVTMSSRVWRKVPESDARIVRYTVSTRMISVCMIKMGCGKKPFECLI